MDLVYLDFAAGALSAPARLLVETHLAMRPERRADVAVWEAIGSELMEGDVEPMSARAYRELESRLDAEPLDEAPAPAANDLPEPLAGVISRDLADLKWTSPMPGMKEWALPQWPTARLLRLKPGGGVLDHSHTGRELTLILKGAYRDEGAVYRAGDLDYADQETWHAPKVVGDEECLCFAVMEGAFRLKPFNRFLASFTGFRDRLA
jgi:putative transcriptional regulator